MAPNAGIELQHIGSVLWPCSVSTMSVSVHGYMPNKYNNETGTTDRSHNFPVLDVYLGKFSEPSMSMHLVDILLVPIWSALFLRNIFVTYPSKKVVAWLHEGCMVIFPELEFMIVTCHSVTASANPFVSITCIYSSSCCSCAFTQDLVRIYGALDHGSPVNGSPHQAFLPGDIRWKCVTKWTAQVKSER